MRMDLNIIDGLGNPDKIKLGGVCLGIELKKQKKESEEAEKKEKEKYLSKTKEQRYEDFLVIYNKIIAEKKFKEKYLND